MKIYVMITRACVPVLLGVLLCLGCERTLVQTPKLGEEKDLLVLDLPRRQPHPDESIPPRYSRAQLDRLQSTIWEAHDELTRSSPMNADSDKKALNDAAWLFSIQLAYRMTIHESGPRIKTRHSDYFTWDLPLNSDAFRADIRWIDNNHIAMENDGHWLVFRAADADD